MYKYKSTFFYLMFLNNSNIIEKEIGGERERRELCIKNIKINFISLIKDILLIKHYISF